MAGEDFPPPPTQYPGGGSVSGRATTSSGEPESTSPGDGSAAVRMMIGGYRIIRKLGAGGMGVVYEAEQQRPKRLVAVKVIQGGRLVNDYHIKRFEREAQALARLKHPGIAAIYESGRTPDGQHFFAMELVRGETLNDYLKRTGADKPLASAQLRDRLTIFRKISDAVTYAHQRGVIHRDLKPANIIVEREFDISANRNEPGTPGIKILDFGLARITEPDVAVATVGTEIGLMLGTLPYMSPEQVRGNPDEIDVRSDVYSLGIILYEMIAGRMPYSVQNVMLHEAVRIICETPPASLSKSWCGTKPLDQDLETIVNKALEKEAPRRYQSVSALSEDIQKFLARQPISARPASAIYQLRKMVTRHKVEFGSAVFVLLLIVAFAVTMSVQAARIAGERDRANREAAASAQVADFLVGIFKASSPAEARGRNVTARELLDKGAERIRTDLSRDPKVQARLLFTTGDVYRNLGVLDRAEELVLESLSILRRTVGPDAPETLRAATLLGTIYDTEGKHELAEKTLTTAAASVQRVLGANHPDALKTLVALANLYDSEGRYDKSVPMMRDIFQRRREALGADDIDTLISQYNLAVGLFRRDQFGQAERLLSDLSAAFMRVAGNDHPDTLMAKDLLAIVYLRLNRPHEAGRIFKEVYDSRRRVLGPEHIDTLASKLGLANVERIEGHLTAAESLYRDTLAAQERVVGADHPDTLATRVSLADMLTVAGRLDEAERLLRDTLNRMQRALGANHPDTANCLGGLAQIELRRGRKEAALRLIQQAIRIDTASAARLAADPAFASLKGNPAFDTLVRTARSQH